jgi:catechol 2,3-dioxygenase-like lactoylglutathione lyase family enzyme
VFDQVTIRVTDRTASEHFYDTVLAPLGIDRTYRTGTRRLHVGFVPRRVTRSPVSGARGSKRDTRMTDGRGRARVPQRLPRGHSCSILTGTARRRSTTADCAAGGSSTTSGSAWRASPRRSASTRRSPPVAGLRLRDDIPERAQFAGSTGSFSLVRGEPTEDLHLASSSDDAADVQRLHHVATGAGYRSNGQPGGRPRYLRGLRARC